jgi:DNA adenine methylase
VTDLVAKPFFRFVGGKTQLLPELRKHVPTTFGRYYEPFVGGGALFWDLAPKDAVLADTNPAIVIAYSQVRNNAHSVIAALRELAYQHDKDPRVTFQRERIATTMWCDCVQCAARFIYLQKTGFNGVWRTNRAGIYNVPLGRSETPPTICDAPLLHVCSQALQGVVVLAQDFVGTVSTAKAGDFVYFDPPYVPVSKTANFTSYTRDGFTMGDQIRLRDIAWMLKQRGVSVMLSNADLPVVRDLYAQFDVHSVQARRNVNSAGTKRGKVGEVIIT